MIGWIATAVLALIITRIVWMEVAYGRKFKGSLASTNQQIESIKQHATERYRAKFGRDPTDTFRTVEPQPTVAAKK